MVENVKKIVKESYSKIAEANINKSSCGCCGCGSKNETEAVSKSFGYTLEELSTVPESNLGLGCGNPTALGEIKKGQTVLDLGSGAGIDCFIAAKKVGEKGKVIGVDMTKKMIQLAKENANKYCFKNVEFKLGDIEKLPIADNSIDVIMSNCVINLAPSKQKVFKEAYRVLKKSGYMLISDIVLLKELSQWQREDKDLIAGCVGGAILRDDYIKIAKEAGFTIKIIDEDKQISKRQYNNIPLESLKIKATK
ncbi:MAG: arsenite methyltransferase [archaeon]